MHTPEPTTDTAALRILLAQRHKEHAYPLLQALVRYRCPIHVTIADASSSLQHVLEHHAYDCVVVDRDLLDVLTRQMTESIHHGSAGCPVLVVSRGGFGPAPRSPQHGPLINEITQAQAVENDTLAQRVEACILASKRRKKIRQKRSAGQRRRRTHQETDRLTGLNNHLHLNRCLIEQRNPNNRPGHQACVVLGIDRLTVANDLWGRQTGGDLALRTVADLIRTHTGSRGLAVRSTGDQFVIIRPNETLSDAWLWAERLRGVIEQTPIATDRTTHRATASLGVAAVGSGGVGEAAIHQANQALAMAKALGRNQVCTWDMVAIQRVLDESDTAGQNLNQRRVAFLDQCKPMLGPTQLEHLTSHAYRVSQVAVEIGRQMGFNAQILGRLQEAAMLHDIGKCVIPESILAKPAALTIQEWRLMGLHTKLGAHIASHLGADEQTTAMILHHHTRYDHPQTATPSRPVGAGVLCVADAFVTITSDRTYRPAHSSTQAMLELQRQSGSQFDPDVVRAAERIGSLLTSQAA